MDLTKDIWYNSYTIAGVTRTSGGVPAYGAQLEGVTFSQAEITGYFDKSALKDGMDSGDVYLGRRIIDIRASVFGSSKGDGFDRLQAFLAAFSPRLAYNGNTANEGFAPFNFYTPTADISTWPTSSNPNGIPMRFYARPSALPTWSVRRDASGGVAANGIAFDVTAQLVAKDPRKYHQTQTTLTLSTSSQTATPKGDYPTWGAVVVTKSATGGSATFTIVIGTSTTIVDLSSSTGSTYTLDLEHRLFYLGSLGPPLGTSRMQWCSQLEVEEIDPGGTVAYIVNDTNISSAVLYYRHAWA